MSSIIKILIFFSFFLLKTSSCVERTSDKLIDADIVLLPQELVVDISPYATIKEALADENNIDWRIEKEKASSIVLAFAAKELIQHFELIEQKLTVLSKASGKASVMTLSIDERCNHITESTAPQNFTVKEIETQSFCIKKQENGVRISAGSKLGVLYGVYDFLDELGFRWLEPNEIIVPTGQFTSVSIRDRQIKPKVALRGGWVFSCVPDDYALWMARNKLNIGGCFKGNIAHKLGMKTWLGGHDLLQEAFSKPELFEKHPEWFAFNNGKRQIINENQGTYYNPAFENIDVANYFSTWLINELSKGKLINVDIINVWPTDSILSYFDQSDEAKRIGNDTDNLLLFYSRVAKKIKEAYDEGRLNRLVVLGGISYLGTFQPPTNTSIIKLLEKNDNYIHIFYPIERSWVAYDTSSENTVNSHYLTSIDKWKESARLQYGLVDYHNLSSFNGIALSDYRNFEVNFSIANNELNTLYAYMHPVYPHPGPRNITNRLLASLTWESKQNKGEVLIDDYFYNRYGAYAAEWKEVHELMDTSISNSKEIFGFNSLTMLLLQDIYWEKPFYTPKEVVNLMNRYLDGGGVFLPSKYYRNKENVIFSNFIGLNESIGLQRLAKRKWRTLLSRVHDVSIKQRMQNDIMWFSSTISRYNLIKLLSDFEKKQYYGENVEELMSNIKEEIDFLRANSATRSQLSEFSYHAFLEDIERKIALK